MKKTLGIMVTVLAVLGLATFSLAAPQTVTVTIPATSLLTLDSDTATITFQGIETWGADTSTEESNEFKISTFHNGSANPDIKVSSGVLTSTEGATIPMANFRFFLTPNGGTEVSQTLASDAVFANVGKGRKSFNAHYGLTIGADQQSGTYKANVTITLENI